MHHTFCTYRRTQIILAVTLLSMFLVGESALVNSRGNYEYFPFYSWSMFALVPQKENVFRLIIHTSKGQEVDFRQAARWVSDPNSLQAYHLIQKLGRALEHRDLLQAREIRNVLETTYLKPGTHYSIDLHREDPLTQWKNRSHGYASDSEGRRMGGFQVKFPQETSR